MVSDAYSQEPKSHQVMHMQDSQYTELHCSVFASYCTYCTEHFPVKPFLSFEEKKDSRRANILQTPWIKGAFDFSRGCREQQQKLHRETCLILDLDFGISHAL